MTMIDRRVLKTLLARHQKLLDSYLELTNHNQSLMREIKWLIDVLQDYNDVREDLPLSQAHLRDRVGTVQARLTQSLKLTLGKDKQTKAAKHKHKHDFDYDIHHFEKHVNTMLHRYENILVLQRIVAKSVIHLEDEMQQLDVQLQQDDSLELYNDILQRHRRLLSYHQQLSKEFSNTRREEHAVKTELKQVSQALAAETPSQALKLAELDFESMETLMEQEGVYLYASDESVEELLHKFREEYNQELAQQKHLQEQQNPGIVTAPQPGQHLVPPGKVEEDNK